MKYYWFLLTELSKRLNIDKDTLHKAFKKGYGIDSLKEADEDYVKEMVAFVAQEFGIILPLPGEPDSETLEKMPFKEFVKAIYSIPDKYADDHFKSQYLFITNKQGKLVCDFIGRIENFKQDFKKICEKIDINAPKKYPHKRKSKRKKDYREYYDEETKKLVEERYKEDLKYFGYKFQ